MQVHWKSVTESKIQYIYIIITSSFPLKNVTVCIFIDLDVTMDELTIDFITMDNDVLSMEIPDFFRDYFLVINFFL